MPNTPTLGSLEKVDLRTCWQTEAQDFTPWLASEENIQLLGQTLGLPELVVEETEANVGPFRADILCTEAGSDGYVLIENQLERTDHRHLGQILTYAAGLEAVKVVWISPEFTEEHRAAVDWLNSITDDEVHFFGVQIELWKIGNSKIAPKFDLIAKPNEWSKSVRSNARGASSSTERTERANSYREWWRGLLDHLDTVGCPFTLETTKPSARNWVAARGAFPLTVKVPISRSLKKNTTGVFILFSDEDGDRKSERAAHWACFFHDNVEKVVDLFPDDPLGWVEDGESGWCVYEFNDDGDTSKSYRWLEKVVPAVAEELNDLWEEFKKQEPK